jgi:hypothetical protein
MASIEIILRDNEGNVIDGEKRIYELNLGNQEFSEVRFHDIEGAVEELKKNALPDITKDLLNKAQDSYKKKKRKYEV